MSQLVDYVKTVVRNKIELKTRVTNEGKLVRDEATDNLLQDIPIYVKQAVIDLQRDNLLPPRHLNLVSVDVKEEQRSKVGLEVLYNYIKLPTDFRELDELIIGGKHYVATDNYVYIKNNYEKDLRPRYTILQVDDDSDQEPKPRLIIYPYPAENTDIVLRYYLDGSETSLRRIDEKYWNAVVKKVEVMLNLTDVMTAQQEINDVVAQNMNTKGNNSYNNPVRRKASFFGKW